ncbi:MAG: hypothetical protein Q9217_007031 [Psora testacea]
MSGLLHQALNAKPFPTVKHVPMNGCEFQSFVGTITSIGTDNLRSCSVVLIASQLGAILAHVQPQASTEQIMDRFAHLYHAHKKQYFPEGNEIWLIKGLLVKHDGDEEVLKDRNRVIERKLKDMGLSEARVSTYKFKERLASQSPSRPGKATVFVDGKWLRPIVYVEDRAVNLG